MVPEVVSGELGAGRRGSYLNLNPLCDHSIDLDLGASCNGLIIIASSRNGVNFKDITSLSGKK